MAAQFCGHVLLLASLLSLSASKNLFGSQQRAADHRCPDRSMSSCVGTQASQPRAADSDPVWVGPHRGKYYTLVKEFASWYDAKAGCQALDARLAAITYDDKAFLSKQLSIIDTYYFWIGLRSNETQFNAGTEFAVDKDYTNWETLRTHEPDGARDSKDDCVFISGHLSGPEYQPAGSWGDMQCNAVGDFICQSDTQDNVCPDEGWEKIGDSCFKLFGSRTNWFDAKKACESHEAWLAEIDFDLGAVKNTALLDTYGAWIGLQSSSVEGGHLVWHTSGKQVTHQAWITIKSDDPNGTEEGDDVCVSVNGLRSLDPYTNGEWVDVLCSFQNYFLCEKDE